MTPNQAGDPAHQEKMQTARFGAKQQCANCHREARIIKEGLCGACYRDAYNTTELGTFRKPERWYTRPLLPQKESA